MELVETQSNTFVRIPAAILYQSGLTLAEKVFLGLLSGFSPRPLRMSNRQLAELLGFDNTRSVSRLLTRLQRQGWIRIQDGRSYRRAVYYAEPLDNGALVNKITDPDTAVDVSPCATSTSKTHTSTSKAHSVRAVSNKIEYNRNKRISLSKDNPLDFSQQVQKTIDRLGLRVDVERFCAYHAARPMSAATLERKLRSWHVNARCRPQPPAERRKNAAELLAAYDASPRSEDRSQKSEVRGQRTEDRGQRSEDRGQRTE